MQDISGFGFQLRVIASKTFPQGFTVTAFGDDADPFDLPSLQINDAAMGLNGDMVTWTFHSPIANVVNVIPKTDDDKNLAVLFEANRAARGKKPARDVISLVAVYPDGSTVTLSKGVCYQSIPGNSIASAGRFKTKPYEFRFEQLARVEV